MKRKTIYLVAWDKGGLVSVPFRTRKAAKAHITDCQRHGPRAADIIEIPALVTHVPARKNPLTRSGLGTRAT
jgi:hypothetical protein